MRVKQRYRWTLITALALAAPSTAFADVPAGMTFDDGFTFYEIENHDGNVDGRRVDEGWALKAHYRVFGTVARRSQFHILIKNGETTLGETRCEVGYGNRNDAAPSFLTTNCLNREQRITQTGRLTVEVYLYDDDSEEEHLLRTHTLDVLSATRVRGNGDPDAPLHYVDRNSEVLGSVLHLQPMNTDPYMAATGRGVDRCGNCNRVTLVMNAHPDREHWSISSSTHLRCRVNGERIEMQDDAMSGQQVRMVYVVHTHGRGRRQEGEQEDVGFRQYHLRLPLNFDNSITVPVQSRQRPPRQRNSHQAYLNDHPGQWECAWRDGSTVLRTWRWTVGPDGHVQPHAETAGGHLTFGPNAFLVDTEIPAGGTVYDTRLHRESVAERAFYGLGWHTDAGRAIAQAVNDFGAMAPPQPSTGRAAAGERRGRRGRRGR